MTLVLYSLPKIGLQKPFSSCWAALLNCMGELGISALKTIRATIMTVFSSR